MIHGDIEVPSGAHSDGGGYGQRSSTAQDASLADLLKRLSSDTTELVREEISLAKAELAQTGRVIAHDAMRVGIGVGLALAGVVALTGFLVIGLGNLIGNYWLSSLVVGVVLAGVGAMMAKGGVTDVTRRGLTPKQTVATLRTDATWAGEQAQSFKRELTADPAAANPKP